MSIDRRQLLRIIASGAAASLLSNSVISQAATQSKIKAIAFDGFPIFDPRPIFGYTWLRTVGGHYKSFYAVIEDALLFSAESLKLDLPPKKQQQLMDVWLNLKVWPDVKPALQQFKKQNIRLGFLSNLTEEMLRANAKNSGIENAFEFYLSTDRVQAHKPSPRAYQMGVDAFGLPKENIAFAAFGGWDASGESWFGYPTVWVNRFGFPEENLGANTPVMGKGISTLIDFVRG